MTIGFVVILIALMLAIFNLISWTAFGITVAVVVGLAVILWVLVLVGIAAALNTSRHFR